MAPKLAKGRWMARYARWHIWLGWLIGVPLLLWTLSGVAMIARPIEEVRGEHLRIGRPPEPLPANAALLRQLALREGVTEISQRMDGGELLTTATFADGRHARFSPGGQAAAPLDAAGAKAIAARDVRGGGSVVETEFFAARDSPLDFRKPVPAWRVTLADGAYVYVGSESGKIEAIRTRWWRIYDFMWGIHIMDLQTREDAHNPFTIVFGALAALGALLGVVLLFRRRKARVEV